MNRIQPNANPPSLLSLFYPLFFTFGWGMHEDEVPKLRFRMVRTHHVEKLTYCRSMVSLTQLQVQKNYLVFECLEGTCLRPLEAYFVSSETKDKEVDGIHVLHDQPMVMTFHCKYLRTWQTLETVQLKKHLRFMIKSSLLNREIPFLSIQNFEEVGIDEV
ncbi:hypothetical protein HMI54_013726 [Coelomomyces lativittatus]|nr:hypothetical protein HMI54_013726 [Coelomomyces lativittatus]